MANTNIINAVFGSGICAVTTSAFRANYGMVLRFSGIDLPTAFEVDFSNYDVAGRDSITAIGQDGEVQIPDDLWDSGLNIYAYVYLHPTDDSGVTVYTVTIPVLGRPNRTDETPTPHEQTVIEQAISALNDAVEQTAADVASADASAQAAAQSEANASVSERSAAASASAALASQNAAESAAQSATESASGAAESARNAANSAAQAAESATSAQESAEQAESSVQSITDDVERAERAANTATDKATEAASSAATASTKAAQAEQSATAAAQSASSASTAAQNAAESEQLAESHATDAEQAKQDAQDAQTAAETAAESVSGLSAQIAQNTADIADLVQNKAGALIDTASGSIASFYPDATVPTVRGLTVNVEPVQDLHGYDNPWPSGGGKNKLLPRTSNIQGTTAYGITFSYDVETEAVTVSGTNTDATAHVFFSTTSPNFIAPTDLDVGDSFYYCAVLPKGTYSQIVYRKKETGVATTLKYINGNGQFQVLSGTCPDDFDGIMRVDIGVSASETISGVAKLMFSTDSTAPTSWTPYKNICPISGWDGVKVTRTGKNLFDQDNTSFLSGNVISYGSSDILGLQQINTLPAGTYTLSFSEEVVSLNGIEPVATRLGLYLRAVSNGAVFNVNAQTNLVVPSVGFKITKSVTFTLTEEYVGKFEYFYVYTGKNDAYGAPNGYTAVFENIQIELGSTATAYEPYQGDTYTIQLGQTVYGGTLDVTTGVLTVDRAMVDLGTLNWAFDNGFFYAMSRTNPAISDIKGGGYNVKANILCSMFNPAPRQNLPSNCISVHTSDTTYITVNSPDYTDVASFKSAVTGQQFVYELATPITVSLTPLEISVLTGQNNIWADSGDVSVEYAADLKTYIDNKIAAAVAALS